MEITVIDALAFAEYAAKNYHWLDFDTHTEWMKKGSPLNKTLTTDEVFEKFSNHRFKSYEKQIEELQEQVNNLKNIHHGNQLERNTQLA
jgi:hypothetical protein